MSPLKIILIVVGSLVALGAIGVGILFIIGARYAENQIDHARQERVRMDLKTIEVSLEGYQRMNLMEPPSQEQGLLALVTQPTVGDVPEKWRPYLATDDALVDPWGNPYQYRVPAEKSNRKFDLWSFGEDGVESADDIGNWP